MSINEAKVVASTRREMDVFLTAVRQFASHLSISQVLAEDGRYQCLIINEETFGKEGGEIPTIDLSEVVSEEKVGPYYRLSVSVGPLHRKNSVLAEEYFFENIREAETLRFLIALEHAAEQGVLGEVFEEFFDDASVQTADESQMLSLLKQIDAERYDGVVSSVVSIIERDDVTECHLVVDAITDQEFAQSQQALHRYVQA